MFAFGVFGLILERQRVPLAPLILGMILGPKIEEYLRKGLIISSGNFTEAFASGISIILSSLLVLIVFASLLRAFRSYQGK